MARDELDRYYTPAGMTRGLLSRVPISGRVLECCAGDGSIAKLLWENPNVSEVITNDIDPAQQCNWHLDATTFQVFDEVQPDWVVTNPPYDSKLLPEIVKNALESARIGVAMLVRLSFLEPTMERDAWLPDNEPDLIIVTPRFSFTRNNKTDSVTTQWVVWYNTLSPPGSSWQTQPVPWGWPRGIKVMHRAELDEVEDTDE